ncbi:MAG: hypothetical protein WA639_06570 [Candidatus Acidiferrum sp.]
MIAIVLTAERCERLYAQSSRFQVPSGLVEVSPSSLDMFQFLDKVYGSYLNLSDSPSIGQHRLLALRARRAYDNGLPFLGAFQRSLNGVIVEAMKCGLGEGKENRQECLFY